VVDLESDPVAVTDYKSRVVVEADPELVTPFATAKAVVGVETTSATASSAASSGRG